jgi:betaine-aldehyde dehydrogenase
LRQAEHARPQSELAGGAQDAAAVYASANVSVYDRGEILLPITRCHRFLHWRPAGERPLSIELPFGGMKRSGLGRENGKVAIEHYSQLKSVYVALGPIEAHY